MKIGVLGTGIVGKTIASRLIVLGHSVTMGSRTADNQAAAAWAETSGENAHYGTFAAAAAYGELIVNATSGGGSLAALEAAGADNLRGKILIDIANPLDFSHGMPPSLSVCNTDSLGEQLQRAHPEVRVVKTLNTMNYEVQVDPTKVPGSHNVFLSGNNADAKAQVAGLLHTFGWPRDDIIDLGDITTARGAEMWLPLWLHLRAAFGTSPFNLKLVR
jgi:predicted dinucleotide-binding enzyme